MLLGGPGVGRDVVVAATISESTWWSYRLGFPGTGRWLEIFNSDVYDTFINPRVAGNGGAIIADGPSAHDMPSSAEVVIPANRSLYQIRPRFSPVIAAPAPDTARQSTDDCCRQLSPD